MVDARIATRESTAWFLIKLFVLFGGLFSLMTGVLGYLISFTHGHVGIWLLCGAFFGVVMTTLLGSMHLIRGRRPGRSGAVRVTQSSRAIVPGPMNKVLEQMRSTLERIHARRIGVVHGETPTLVAHMPMTFWSFGEKIGIALQVLQNRTVQVDMSSRPLIFVTMVDYSKNLENVEAILQGLATSGKNVHGDS